MLGLSKKRSPKGKQMYNSLVIKLQNGLLTVLSVGVTAVWCFSLFELLHSRHTSPAISVGRGREKISIIFSINRTNSVAGVTIYPILSGLESRTRIDQSRISLEIGGGRCAPRLERTIRIVLPVPRSHAVSAKCRNKGNLRMCQALTIERRGRNRALYAVAWPFPRLFRGGPQNL